MRDPIFEQPALWFHSFPRVSTLAVPVQHFALVLSRDADDVHLVACGLVVQLLLVVAGPNAPHEIVWLPLILRIQTGATAGEQHLMQTHGRSAVSWVLHRRRQLTPQVSMAQPRDLLPAMAGWPAFLGPAAFGAATMRSSCSHAHTYLRQAAHMRKLASGLRCDPMHLS